MAELKKLGRYELRRVLGRGAMGVVYEGFDPTLGRLVAVKTILRNAAIDEETERSYSERFVREAKAVARLNHPHIIQVHDFGVENDVAYLVMEFIRGRELRGYFDSKERFEIAEAVRIMGELLDALDFAHEAGVIHRDVKPANVMLDAQRRVKLADFGVARVQDSDKSAAGTMVGTPAFMSPEQIQGHKIDRRTDIFSAGVILYQLLTGEQPFKGEGAWTVAKKIMQDDPPQPSSLVASISPVFDAIVDKALAKTPAERFANAREFAAELRGAITGVQAAAISDPREVEVRKTMSVPRANDMELEFWRSIQNTSVPAELEAYLSQFPAGTYARLAKVKLASLRGSVRSIRDDATVAIPAPLRAGKRLSVILIGIAAALLAAGIVAYSLVGRAPQVESSKVEVSAADIERIRKETEERIRREYADKSVVERAAAAKVATERAVQERQAALDAAAEKAAVEKEVAAKLVAERALMVKSANEKAAAEKVAAGKLATERAASEKIAAQKAAVEKVLAEKAAAERAAADIAAAEKEEREKALSTKAAQNAAARSPVSEMSESKSCAYAMIFKFADSSKGCFDDYRILRKLLSKDMPATWTTVAVAVTQDVDGCRPYSWSAWNWRGKDAQVALEKCNAAAATKSSRPEGCRCEILFDSNNPPDKQTLLQKMKLLELVCQRPANRDLNTCK